MSSTKELYGTTRTIPSTNETGWGSEVSSILEDVCDGLNSISTLIGTTGILKFLSTSTSVTSGLSLSQTHLVHLVTGSGGAVALNSTTPIAKPSDNRMIVLIGTSDTNTVEINPATDCHCNGQCVLGENDVWVGIYNATQGKWIEIFRSN